MTDDPRKPHWLDTITTAFADTCDRRDTRNGLKTCNKCKREIGPDEPIWRGRTRRVTSMGYGRGYMLAHLCDLCGPSDWRDYGRAMPCESCRRPVHYSLTNHWRTHTYCDSRCEYEATKAKARRRRAEARGETRDCEVCGEVFEPVRADAKYCGSPCRQKAYRRRVTSNKVPAVG